MYERYQVAPGSLSEAWRRYFEGNGEIPTGDGAGSAGEPAAPPPALPTAAASRTVASGPAASTATVTAHDAVQPDAAAVPAAPTGTTEYRGAPEATGRTDVIPDPPTESPEAPDPQPQPARPDHAEGIEILKGAAATIAERMGASREIPTATSVRTFPAKLLEVNRTIINNQLARRAEGGKVSFTHLIGWAVVRALCEQPSMNAAYTEVDGKPARVAFEHINLGLAMDLPKKGGGRTLLVPNLKQVDDMDFKHYWQAYEEVVARVRAGSITPDDFAGTTATLTNPGTVGTVQSVPRLMPDQGVIVGVGRIGFPPEYEGSDPEALARVGLGRTLTMTSTYDHRIIQGAESGMFLARVHELLLGEDDFYDEIFRAMDVPYVPVRWAVDSNPAPGSQAWAEKQARIFQLINMYRVRGHLIADLDPLRQQPPKIHDELDPIAYGLSLWDLDREFATGGLAGRARMTLGEILGVLRNAYCRTSGIEYMHIQEPDQKLWIQEHAERPVPPISTAEKRRLLAKLIEAESFERFLHTKFLGAKRFSLEGAESLIPLLDVLLNAAADSGVEDVVLGLAHRGRLNVLANTAQKDLAAIFHEFVGHEEPDDAGNFSGDVKYHLGARGIHVTPDGRKVGVEVAANPSHLEAVDPVLEGITRA
ncbi:MAG: 2-oxo acid dehydrogenase subunit E2, partial [Acidimicrobiia bacterium]|nr:2-oxo acid dehydrogenase subunit E2 [Acidimicrobiia bacterium]